MSTTDLECRTTSTVTVRPFGIFTVSRSMLNTFPVKVRSDFRRSASATVIPSCRAHLQVRRDAFRCAEMSSGAPKTALRLLRFLPLADVVEHRLQVGGQ